MNSPAYPNNNGLGYTPVNRKQPLHTRPWFAPVVMLLLLIGVVGGLTILSAFAPDPTRADPSSVSSVSQLLVTSSDIGGRHLQESPPN